MPNFLIFDPKKVQVGKDIHCGYSLEQPAVLSNNIKNIKIFSGEIFNLKSLYIAWA